MKVKSKKRLWDPSKPWNLPDPSAIFRPISRTKVPQGNCEPLAAPVAGTWAHVRWSRGPCCSSAGYRRSEGCRTSRCSWSRNKVQPSPLWDAPNGIFFQKIIKQPSKCLMTPNWFHSGWALFCRWSQLILLCFIRRTVRCDLLNWVWPCVTMWPIESLNLIGFRDFSHIHLPTIDQSLRWTWLDHAGSAFSGPLVLNIITKVLKRLKTWSGNIQINYP